MKADKRKTVDIIVPCYNEEDVLDKFYEETLNVIKDIEGYDFRCLFIDDGSTDGTLDIIKGFAQSADSCRIEAADGLSGEPQTSETLPFAVKYISFSRNPIAAENTNSTLTLAR
jgi:glycosyltransferase involved in cell wall biosynthesis